MDTCKKSTEEIIDQDGTVGYIIVLISTGTILGLYLSAVYLSLKGVNIF
jgi:hypothetical protein